VDQIVTITRAENYVQRRETQVLCCFETGFYSSPVYLMS